MSLKEPAYRQRSPDGVVEPRAVVDSPAPLPASPAYAERGGSRDASQLATCINGIYLVLAVAEGMIAIRFVLKLLAASPQAWFARFIDTVTTPLVAPFAGLLNNPSTNTGNQFEATSLAAMAVYVLAAGLLTRIVRLVFNRTATRSRRDFR